MADLSGYAQALRAGRYRFKGWLATQPPTVILAGSISAVPAYPALAIAYTVDSGDYTDVTAGMTVVVFDNVGRKKGVLRVATGASITSTSLPVNEFSRGVVDILDSDTFEVWQTRSIWDKLVSATDEFNKDSRIAFVDQTEDLVPIVNAGGPAVGWGSNGALDTTFYGSTSTNVDPDASGLAFSWSFGGDATPPTSSSGEPTVSIPTGYREVVLEVTDTNSSKTATKYPMVWAFEKGVYEPLAIDMRSLEYTDGDGWRATFELPKDAQADLDVLPEGALVVYFEDEWYDGEKVSYGANVPDRSQIKFSGYLRRESIVLDDKGDTITFEAVSPLAILRETPALPQLLISSLSPTSWQNMYQLSIHKLLHYLWYWHSTLGDVWDVVFINAEDANYERIAIENPRDLASQLIDAASSIRLDLTCDRLGRIIFAGKPNLKSLANRASSIVRTYDFTTADMVRFEFSVEHRGTTKFVRGEGIMPNGTTLFSNAPGNAYASFGTDSDVFPRQIPESQQHLDILTGLRFAELNSIYAGQFVPKGATCVVPDGYGIFEPAYREFVSFILPASTNRRGRSFDISRHWTVDAVSIRYDNDAGTKDIALTVSHETYAAQGTPYTPAPSTNAPPWEQPDPSIQFPDVPILTPVPIYNPAPSIDGQPEVPTEMFVVGVNIGSANNEIYRGIINDFDTGDVTLTSLASGVTGTFLWARGNPYDLSEFYVGTSTGIWLVDYYNGGATQLADLEGIFGSGATTWPSFFELSNNREGFMVVMAGGNGPNSAMPTSGAVSFDGGSSWEQFDIAGGTPTFTETGGMYVHTVAVSPYNNPNSAGQGWLYSAYYSAANTLRVMRSTDWGLTWSQLMTITVANTDGHNNNRLFIPYTRSGGVPNKNDANQRVHFITWTGNDGEWGTFDAAGNLYNNYVPSATGNPMGQSDLLPMNTLTADGAYYYMVSHRSTSGVGVLRSDDAGAAFTSAVMNPATSALAIGSEANGGPLSASINGWVIDGTLINFSPGHGTNNVMHTAYLNTTTLGSGSVKTAYAALGENNPVGFLRIRRAPNDWVYVKTPASGQKICAAEFKLV